MKTILKFIILLIVLFLVYFYRTEILSFCIDHFLPLESKITKLEKNEYYRDYNFRFVSNTENFIPQNEEDLKNIYYTVVNSGMTEFHFYCPGNYKNCQDDVNYISNSQDIISNINNFVHPYNSFKTIKTEVQSLGKVTINIEKVYDEKDIILLNYKIDEIINKIITEKDTKKNQIKKIHDYIINNTKYDKERSDYDIVKYDSDNAYGVLIEGYGICGGYTDAMMLFLEKLDILSYRIASNHHIWNYLQLDDKWLHLDLTWDDPISNDGSDIIDYNFFLITDSKLEQLETNEHTYNKDIYCN